MWASGVRESTEHQRTVHAKLCIDGWAFREGHTCPAPRGWGRLGPLKEGRAEIKWGFWMSSSTLFRRLNLIP